MNICKSKRCVESTCLMTEGPRVLDELQGLLKLAFDIPLSPQIPLSGLRTRSRREKLAILNDVFVNHP